MPKFFLSYTKSANGHCGACKEEYELGTLHMTTTGGDWDHHLRCGFSALPASSRIETLDDLEGYTKLEPEHQRFVRKLLRGKPSSAVNDDQVEDIKSSEVTNKASSKKTTMPDSLPAPFKAPTARKQQAVSADETVVSKGKKTHKTTTITPAGSTSFVLLMEKGKPPTDFWEMTMNGTEYSIRSGKAGTSGKTKSKLGGLTTDQARAAVDKLIAFQKRQGFSVPGSQSSDDEKEEEEADAEDDDDGNSSETDKKTTVKRKKGAFAGLSFVFSGIFTQPLNKLKGMVTAQGGTIESKIGDNSTDYLVYATSQDTESFSTKYKQAAHRGVPVVNEAFITDTARLGKKIASDPYRVDGNGNLLAKKGHSKSIATVSDDEGEENSKKKSKLSIENSKKKYFWQWQDHCGSWHDFSVELDKQIRDSNKLGDEGLIPFSIGSQKYELNLKDRSQTNLSTAVVRRIRPPWK